jgi:hypothetical protein
LLVVRAEDVASIHARLATDPWTNNLLRTTRVVRWTLRLGTLGDGS